MKGKAEELLINPLLVEAYLGSKNKKNKGGEDL